MKQFLQRCAVGLLAAATVSVVGQAGVSRAIGEPVYRGLSPARLMDTRPGSPTVDGLAAGAGPLGANSTTNLTVVGRGAVPATGVSAVALNVTATAPTAAGYITVFPAGATRPTASNLNYTPGQTIPNMVIASVGTSGQISLFNFTSGTTHVIVDVLGYFPTGTPFTGTVPARLLDTRPGFTTVDSIGAGGGAIPAHSETTVMVGGRAGGAGPTGSVALNVTVTGPTGTGYLTVYPTGTTRPTASNLNFTPGQTIPNMVIVPIGTGQLVTIYNGSDGTANVVVDLLGSFPDTLTFTGSKFSGQTPTRLLDTRIGQPTIDGRFSGTRSIGEATTLNLAVAGRGGLPANTAGSVALNVTVTNPTAAGYLTVYPTGGHPPTASNLNFTPGQTIANMVIVPVGTSGQVSIYNSAGNSDVVVDLLGSWPSPSNPPAVFGNSLTLKSNAIGTVTFGSTPASFVAAVTPLFGAAVGDETLALPSVDPGTGLHYDDQDHFFAYPFARSICFDDYALCGSFGGSTASNLTFVGYSYYSDPQALLLDPNGVGIGSRPADFPGAINVEPGGCSSEGAGTTASGIRVSLHSEGVQFNDYIGPDDNDPKTPPDSDVYIRGLQTGSVLQGLGDC
ncbi:MAG: hypothetical protein JWM34_131 [Ilumatobacteraceae bacterium]|nr:hypothetical protein [Ilumatobacteraceae bacterium]